MKLFTEEQYQRLIENGTPERRDNDHPPVVKLFLPGTACTWLLSELDYEDTDIAFGLCDLGLGFPELGSVRVSELEQLKVPFYGFAVERDIHFTPKFPMSVYAEAALLCDAITENPIHLERAAVALKTDKLQPE